MIFTSTGNHIISYVDASGMQTKGQEIAAEAYEMEKQEIPDLSYALEHYGEYAISYTDATVDMFVNEGEVERFEDIKEENEQRRSQINKKSFYYPRICF